MDSPWQRLFANVSTEPATRRYAIAFTPRSGSSWLEDLLSRTGILGTPQEWFNPKAARQTIRRSGAANLPDYYAYLQRVMRTGDIFGVELTWPHIQLVLDAGHPELFADIDPWFVLRRRDFVAQGVSLYKAERSGRYHSIQADAEADPLDYDAAAIARCVLRLMANEFALQQFFKQRQVTPRALWYETLVAMPPEALLRQFIADLGLPAGAYDKMHCDVPGSTHSKLGDSQSNAMIARFRDEHVALCEFWEEHRGQRPLGQFTRTHPEYQLTP